MTSLLDANDQSCAARGSAVRVAAVTESYKHNQSTDRVFKEQDKLNTHGGFAFSDSICYDIIQHVPLQNLLHQMPPSARWVKPVRLYVRDHEL